MVKLDDEGYLMNFDDWDEHVACMLAEREGVEELKKERLEMLRFIRDYYARFNFFPILHSVCKPANLGKACIREEFMHPLAAWKLSGLPRPDDNMINVIEHGQIA